jgi:hypothetical protein
MEGRVEFVGLDDYPTSWDALDSRLVWSCERRPPGGISYSWSQWERPAAIDLFETCVRASPGMDVRLLCAKEIDGPGWPLRYLLAERTEPDRARVKLYDPPLLAADKVDEGFAKKLVVSERRDFQSRRCSHLAGMISTLQPGTVLSRRRIKQKIKGVVDEGRTLAVDADAKDRAWLAQIHTFDFAERGGGADQELAEAVVFEYFPTPAGSRANGGVLLNLADGFAPSGEQMFGAVVLRGKAIVRLEHLIFDNTVQTDQERQHIADSLFEGAGVYVGER